MFIPDKLSIKYHCILFFLTITAGCSTSTIKETTNISKQGVEYSDSVLQITDFTINEIVDHSSEVLIENRQTRLKKIDEKELAETFA